MMSKTELLELYKALFETWRFEVNSHWQRSSYFAAFETVAIAGCWKLVTDSHLPKWPGIVLSILGITLTAVWFLNNDKTRYYARFWFGAVTDIERRLLERTGEQDVDFATQILNRQRTDLIQHPYLVQAVPTLFLIAWIVLLFFAARPAMIESAAVSHFVTSQSIAFAIAIASLFVSTASVLIAGNSLSQAKQVAAREQREWRERKWIDMYLKANEIYDALDRFHVLSASWTTEEWQQEWNELMCVIRAAHAIAVVFPINSAIDEFISATAVFKDERTVSDNRLARVFDAVELIRDRAKMHASVLE